MAQTINLSLSNDLMDECRDYFDGDSTSDIIGEIRDFCREQLREEVELD